MMTPSIKENIAPSPPRERCAILFSKVCGRICEHNRLGLCRHQQAGRRSRSPKTVRRPGRGGAMAERNDREGVAFEYRVLGSID